jgi:hypothetical protein
MREKIEAAILVGHAGILPRGVQHIQVGNGILAAQHAFQIRREEAAGGGPSLADEIELVRSDSGEIEAGADGESGKPGIMLDPADAFLGHGKEQFAVARDTCGRIVHLRIIKTKSDH